MAINIALDAVSQLLLFASCIDCGCTQRHCIGLHEFHKDSEILQGREGAKRPDWRGRRSRNCTVEFGTLGAKTPTMPMVVEKGTFVFPT
jgi:hypothetical protein